MHFWYRDYEILEKVIAHVDPQLLSVIFPVTNSVHSYIIAVFSLKTKDNNNNYKEKKKPKTTK